MTDSSERAGVPAAVRLAADWAWRLLLVAAALGVVIFLVRELRTIVVPFLVAVLLSALLVPFSNWLQRHKWPKWLAVAVNEVGVLAIIGGLVTLVVFQVRGGWAGLVSQTESQFHVLVDWLATTPFQLTEADLLAYWQAFLESLQNDLGGLVSGALPIVSSTLGVLAGVLITLFTTLFILIDGGRIWGFLVGLFPRAARPAITGAGAIGWATLSQFVRVQIFVAFVDAVGIGAGALILGLPLAIPIAIAVFIGSFIPVVGAVITGALAVFVALVYQGPVIALIMLGIVILVQQVEGHVLQPFVMGSAVKVHPLAVVLAVATGGVVAGIPGALFAVPLVATANAMIRYVAGGTWRAPELDPEPDAKGESDPA